MKVVVTNAVLGNSGDAAIFEGIATSLVQLGFCTQREIIVLDSTARSSQSLYPDWTVLQQPTLSPARSRVGRRIGRQVRDMAASAVIKSPLRIVNWVSAIASGLAWMQAVRAMSEADVVISSGGTYLVDHYDFSTRAREIELAQRLSGFVVLWTQSMGPFINSAAKKAILRIVKNVDGVFFRDGRSEQAWRTISLLPALTAVVPDVAFVLSGSPITKSLEVPHPRRAIISVRSWQRGVSKQELDFDDYVRAMREAAVSLLDQGWICVALSTCQGVEDYPIDDSKTARLIFEGLDVSIDDTHHTPTELLGLLREVDLVISTRMHLAILSLVAQTPVIAVAYEFKTQELFRGLGLGQYVSNIEDLNGNWLRKWLEGPHGPHGARLSAEQVAELTHRANMPARELVAMSTLTHNPARNG